MRNAALALLLITGSAFAEQPRIDSISPAEGPIAGGTIVTISGANFTGAAVKLDGGDIAPQSQSATEVRLQMPKHDNGYALIQVGGASAEFIYLAPRLEDLPPGSITTVAGVGQYIRFEQPATRSMVSPWGIALAPNGDIYFAQASRNLVMRVRTDGILQRIAGSLRSADIGKLGDGGPALDAYIGFPRSVVLDPAGNVYVGDSRARIRRIDITTGIITTVAGNGTAGFSGDGGPAAAALLTQPTHLFSTPDGTIYFLDNNVRVRKITPDGIIDTVAGNGTVGESGDGGPATSAQLDTPIDDSGDVEVDADGNLYILETEGARVRKVDAKSGIITTFASSNARGKPFQKGRGIAIDSSGNVYVAERGAITKFDPAGHLIDSWGTGIGFSEDGAVAKQSLIGSPMSLEVAPNGDIIWADEEPSRLRKINLATGKLETLAGMAPEVIGVPGPASGVVFTSPWGDLALGPSGDLFFVDGNANWIYRISGGMVTKYAGSGTFGGIYEESPALGTAIVGPVGMKFGPDGLLYFVDKQTVRRIDANGIVHRYAGGSIFPPCGLSGDGGPARTALLCQPNDFVFDSGGNMLIADTNNNRIRRVDALTGVMTSIAGSNPPNGFEHYGSGSLCGDGGAAKEACLNTPIALTVRDDGTIYFVDHYQTQFIRKITPNGIITSLPNWPQKPRKLILGPGQRLFANGGNLIMRVDDDRVRPVAGNGILGFGGDGGPALKASTASGEAEPAWGIAIDAEGNLFIHDAGNRRIRAVRFGALLAPANAKVQATANGAAIRATVFDSSDHILPGVRVDFTAPSTGPSCTLAKPFAITDANGVATTTCTPSCRGNGSFTITVRPLTASATASVTMYDSTLCRRRP